MAYLETSAAMRVDDLSCSYRRISRTLMAHSHWRLSMVSSQAIRNWSSFESSGFSIDVRSEKS
eukprot:2774712-Heterocapsa_arctica.AAC.1